MDERVNQRINGRMGFLRMSECMDVCVLLYCTVSIHSYSTSCSAHQSETLPVRETQGEESSLERTKRATYMRGWLDGSIDRWIGGFGGGCGNGWTHERMDVRTENGRNRFTFLNDFLHIRFYSILLLCCTCRSFLFSASSVASDVTGNCEVSLLHRHPIALPRPEALLHCGSEISPWILKVPSGQRINITLFEFYSFSSSSSTPSSLTSTSPTSSSASHPRSAVHPARTTALFARVRETWPVGGGETVDVRALLSPSTVARETHVHTTLSNSVEVTLNGSGKDEFLLTFAGERQRYKLT